MTRLDLPEGERGEMDIEGLDIDGGCLWAVGSHSLTRACHKAAKRRSACLKMKDKGGALAEALAGDVHSGRFMGVPGTENGFDIEGVAAQGERLFLGLRGPVLRGWATLLKPEVKGAGRGASSSGRSAGMAPAT